MSELNLFNNFIKENSLILINRYIKSSSTVNIKNITTINNDEGDEEEYIKQQETNIKLDLRSLKNFMINHRFSNDLHNKIKSDLDKNGFDSKQIKDELLKILSNSEIELCIYNLKDDIDTTNDIIENINLDFISNSINSCLLSDKKINILNRSDKKVKVINNNNNKTLPNIYDNSKWIIIGAVIIILFILIFLIIKKNNKMGDLDNLVSLNSSNKYFSNVQDNSIPDLGTILNL